MDISQTPSQLSTRFMDAPLMLYWLAEKHSGASHRRLFSYSFQNTNL